jgi:hypothetical protein
MTRIDPTRLLHRLAVALLVLGMARFPLPSAPEESVTARQDQQGPVQPFETESEQDPFSWLLACTEVEGVESERDTEAEVPLEEGVTGSSIEVLLDQRGGHSRLLTSTPAQEIERLATHPMYSRVSPPLPPYSGESIYIRHLSGADGPTCTGHSVRV